MDTATDRRDAARSRDPGARGDVFFFLSKLLDVFLSPLTWGLLLILMALPLRRPRRRLRRWRQRRALGLAGVGLLLLFSFEPVSNRMMYALEHAATSTYRPDETYDVVIMLGGISDERVTAETGQPAYNENIERLTMTRQLLADNRARFAILSGAAYDPKLVEFGEARVLARQLVAWGIEPSRILIEEKSRNTRENAVYSRDLAAARGFGKVLLVTSAFHMPRAVECFAAVGMRFDTLVVDYRAYRGGLPSSYFPRSGYLHDSARTLREVAGLWVYRLQGYGKKR